MIPRHRFQPNPERPLVCAVCGMARGSVYHSALGSNESMEYRYLRRKRQRAAARARKAARS